MVDMKNLLLYLIISMITISCQDIKSKFENQRLAQILQYIKHAEVANEFCLDLTGQPIMDVDIQIQPAFIIAEYDLFTDEITQEFSKNKAQNGEALNEDYFSDSVSKYIDSITFRSNNDLSILLPLDIKDTDSKLQLFLGNPHHQYVYCVLVYDLGENIFVNGHQLEIYGPSVNYLFKFDDTDKLEKAYEKLFSNN